MRRLLLPAVLAISITPWIAGCGGGGGDSTPAVTAPAPTANVNVTVNWAARTRDVDAPASALSAVFTLKGADPTGSDFAFTINRDSPPAAYKKSYSSPRLAKLGTWDLAARFYAQPDGQGAVVGKIDAQINLTADGKGIGDFATTGTVASVAVAPHQTIPVGAPTDILFVAKDSTGADLALTPGSAKFQVVSGNDVLSINAQGQAVGTKPGTATVNVTVDGKTSADQQIAVGNIPAVTITPAATTTLINGQVTFAATVKGSPDDSAVNFSVQEGAIGGAIRNNAYIAPPTPGTYHVIASSHLDTSKTAVATVTVTAPAQPPSLGIFVADGYSRIVRFDDMSGAGWNAFAGPASGPGVTPTAVVVAPDGRIYYSDQAGNRIVRMDDITGKNTVSYGSTGSGVGHFNSPGALFVTGTGDIYIADVGNARVVRISDMTGASWTELHGVDRPALVFVSPDSHIYVGYSNGGVSRFDDMSGAGQQSLGTTGRVLAVTNDGKIYSVGGNVIIAYDSISSQNATSSPFGVGSGVRQLNYITAMTVAADGRIYVADATGRVIRMDDLTGTNWVSLGGGGTGIGSFYGPTSISVH